MSMIASPNRQPAASERPEDGGRILLRTEHLIMRKSAKEQQGVQGVEIGLRLATLLAQTGRPMSLGELATGSSLLPSKTHRYMVSLVRSGLVTQDSRDQCYKLGGGAIYLGLAAQNVSDEYQLLNEGIEALHRETGYAVAVMVWGATGPIVVRTIEPADQSIMVVAKLGAVITVTNSASGHLFAAFMPSEVTSPVIEREFEIGVLSAATNKPVTRSEFARSIDQVRRDGIASVSGVYRAGYSTLGVPVFKPNGEMMFAITVVAPIGVLDTNPRGDAAKALRRCADHFEAGLGARR